MFCVCDIWFPSVKYCAVCFITVCQMYFDILHSVYVSLSTQMSLMLPVLLPVYNVTAAAAVAVIAVDGEEEEITKNMFLHMHV